MAFPGVLHTVALLLLQGGFPGAGTETVTLKEGEDLNLHCSPSTLSNSSSSLQWSNPRGFTIFLNAWQVLRDQRYKLVRYSRDELSIRLSNVTVGDEGAYECRFYGTRVETKSHNVRVWAAPSNPVLEVSQDAGRGIKLSCYTQGCNPQPQVTWLLDNGIELPGDTRHKLGADGKKWSTSSTLRVLSYRPNVTASCIIHHPALRAEKLVASLRFQDLPSKGCKPSTSPSEDGAVSSPSEDPAAPSPSEDPAAPSPSATPEHPELTNSSAAPKDSAGTSPSASPEAPADPSSAATPAQQNLTADATSNGTETAPHGNVTKEEFPRTEASAPRENVTVISTLTLEQNPKSKGIIKKEKNLLLPMLVAALILVLLIIVLLFMLKLKKAHGVWKRENDVSEQTLESYKSRSNEDSPGHEKNGQAVNAKSNVQYVTEGYGETPEKTLETPEKTLETPEKNLETPEKNPGDKSIGISKKMFQCGKETDV